MTGLWLPHFKNRVVRPALLGMGPGCYSEAAVNLVTGTALVESGLQFLAQGNNGPAMSLFQIEPVTLFDIWDRWLRLPAQQPIRSRMIEMIPAGCDIKDQIMFDMRFGAMICRCRYRMSPRMLPDARDAVGLSGMHKDVYNTADGAAVVSRNIPLFAAVIAAPAE